MRKGPRDKFIDTLFRVPNTPEGLAFLKQMRGYAAGGTRIIPVGRGPRVKAALANNLWRRSYDQRLPLKAAEYFAIYIKKPALERIVNRRENEYIRTLHTQIQELTTRLGGAAQELKLTPLPVLDWRVRRRIELE
jgi:hypothetical protein